MKPQNLLFIIPNAYVLFVLICNHLKIDLVAYFILYEMITFPIILIQVIVSIYTIFLLFKTKTFMWYWVVQWAITVYIVLSFTGTI